MYLGKEFVRLLIPAIFSAAGRILRDYAVELFGLKRFLE